MMENMFLEEERFYENRCTYAQHDAEVCPKKMIEASIQKGLKAICFTDHYDKDDDQWGEGEQIFDVDEYFTTMTRLREQYRDQIEVRIGVELGLRPHLVLQQVRSKVSI